MERRKKIDNSLQERHGIIRLLERLKNDNITFDEIQDIGIKLRKSGKRALSPLVRRLWKERSGDLISKYTYLLDFFEDDIWLDQLIQIALRRRDLGEEGKAAFLAALEGYGVDVSHPPFATMLADMGGPVHATLPKLLDRGDEGMACFLEDYLYSAPEMKRAIVRELPNISDTRVVSLLEILLRVDDGDTRSEAIAALGKIRDPRGSQLLNGLCSSGDEAVRAQAERSLRRLSFAGMDTASAHVTGQQLLPFYASCVSPLDGGGFRSLWICRWHGEAVLSSLFVQLHDKRGMTAAWGSSGQDVYECARQWEEMKIEEGVMEVPPDYALRLIGDAVYRNGKEGGFLPPEYYVLAGMFQPGEVVPAPYVPDFSRLPTLSPAKVSTHIARSSVLFDEAIFSDWYFPSHRVYDYAEEWVELERNLEEKALVGALESLVERFCDELLQPELENIRDRMLLTADLVLKSGKGREALEQTIAVARNLTDYPLPLHRHPFLRRFALESMDMARESLAEGYDIREYDQFQEDDWD